MKAQTIHIFKRDFFEFNKAVDEALAEGYMPMFPVSISTNGLQDSPATYFEVYSLFMHMEQCLYQAYKRKSDQK